MNEILPGRHYGFPYQFSNWKKKPYRYTPDPPPGLQFELPIANFGPAGGRFARALIWGTRSVTKLSRGCMPSLAAVAQSPGCARLFCAE